MPIVLVGFDFRRKIVDFGEKFYPTGNIDVDKLEKIFKFADIVDVSGALETNKVKDISKIKNFLNSLKKLNNEN